jgi:energy-coupling factor transporter ATP-binding protein EcfA2
MQNSKQSEALPKEQIHLNTVKSSWKTAQNSIYPHFEEDDNNRAVIHLLQLWAARHPDFETAAKGCNFSLGRGIALMGPFGTGKTVLMRILQRTLYYLQSPYQMQVRPMRTLVSEYEALLKNKVPMKESQLPAIRRHWFVDELGLTEREAINNYGPMFNVGDEVIGFRYDLFQQQQFLTHFTTNLTIDAMRSFYDGRTVSRLQEMCNFIPLSGTDRRINGKPVIKPAEQEAHAYTPEQKRQFTIAYYNSIPNYQVRFTDTGQLDVLLPAKMFQDLRAAGIIHLTDDQYNNTLKRAKAAVLQHCDQRIATSGDAAEVKASRNIKARISDGKPDKMDTMLIVAKARELALIDFFTHTPPATLQAKIAAHVAKL